MTNTTADYTTVSTTTVTINANENDDAQGDTTIHGTQIVNKKGYTPQQTVTAQTSVTSVASHGSKVYVSNGADSLHHYDTYAQSTAQTAFTLVKPAFYVSILSIDGNEGPGSERHLMYVEGKIFLHFNHF